MRDRRVELAVPARSDVTLAMMTNQKFARLGDEVAKHVAMKNSQIVQQWLAYWPPTSGKAVQIKPHRIPGITLGLLFLKWSALSQTYVSTSVAKYQFPARDLRSAQENPEEVLAMLAANPQPQGHEATASLVQRWVVLGLTVPGRNMFFGGRIGCLYCFIRILDSQDMLADIRSFKLDSTMFA